MTDEKEVTTTGGCLCGAVRFEIRGPLRPAAACHCTQCRKSSGHFFAATAARDTDLALSEKRGLKWYRSSAKARRGFCAECGSSLFWKADEATQTAIAMGSLDGDAGLELVAHIFVDDAGDYYEIGDGLRQLPQGGHGIAIPEEF